MDWEFGVNRCKLLPLEWISNEILLYGPGNYISSHMMEHHNMRRKICTCMCDWITLLYSKKLTEHCKPAIIENSLGTSICRGCSPRKKDKDKK